MKKKMLENIDLRDEKVDKVINSKNEIFKCDVCGSEYKRLGYLKLHMKNKHEAEAAVGFKCELCDIKFDEVKYLNRHHKHHHSSIVCTLCGLECDNKEVYDSHLNTQHVNCDVCNKKFDTHNKFKRHMKLHK